MSRRDAEARRAGCPAERPGRCGAPACRDGCYYGTEYLQDIVEQALITQGGEELLADAHDRAAEFVDQVYPWDGTEPEPAARVDAYIAVLWRVAKNAQTDQQHGSA